ncbi:RICIN domain-containing protein [Streptomyces sp. SBT349]|uniref:RICIN domain-containing protein n=1 Tax=Streptomyces sp. SBT349 TaxID=1580539 RepID=UPI00066E951F|nr:ricin-type beta-trefoil lectin domain protein [Streptomyces sp. SBT349]
MRVLSRVLIVVAGVALSSGHACPSVAVSQDASVLVTRTLKNLGTQGCLSDEGQDIAAVDECAAGSTRQQWDVSGPAIAQRLRNVATGQCLSDGGEGVAVMGPCGEPPHVEPASLWVGTGPEGARQFRNLVTGQCLAAIPGITVAVIGQCSDATNQQWGTAG